MGNVAVLLYLSALMGLHVFSKLGNLLWAKEPPFAPMATASDAQSPPLSAPISIPFLTSWD